MPETKNAKAQETKADETLRRRLAELVEAHGEAKAVKALDIPRQTFARLIGGLSVRRATLRDARTQLDKLAPVDAIDSMKGGNHGHE